jgi:hypothetical protein
VLIPAFDRPEMVWLCLDHLAACPEARAVEILSVMNDGLVDAVLAALPDPSTGAMWIPLDYKHEFEALAALGICTQSSEGQRLTPVGIQIHDALNAEGQ